MAVNWSLLQQPDIAGNALTAFNQGRQQGQERATRNALSAYANDPSQIAGVIAADPSIGIQLQREHRQQEQLDAQLARQGKQDARTEDQATRTRHREAFVGFMSSLASVPEAQRRQAAQQLLQTNPGQWTPEQVMQIATTLSSPNADFSDNGIRSAIRAAGGDPNAGAYNLGRGEIRYDASGHEIARGAAPPANGVAIAPGGSYHILNADEINGWGGGGQGAPPQPGMAAPPAQGQPAAQGQSTGPVSFRAPVNGPVTSGFGHRTAPTAGASSEHMAIDYGVPVGTPVGAMAEGVVEFAGPRGGLGNAVIIRHPDGSTSTYAHLSAANVQPGALVQAGQPIGASGQTGTVTGPNLHIAVRDAHGNPVDPRTLFGRPANQTTPPTRQGGIPDTIQGPPRERFVDDPQHPGTQVNTATGERRGTEQRTGRQPTAEERARGIDFIRPDGEPHYDPNAQNGRQARRDASTLRREFNNLPDVRQFEEIATSYGTIRRLSTAPPTAQNDIAMVYAYMRMLDPTSVVRETEFATAQNAAGVPERIRNLWNNMLNGQRLSPNQRSEFTNTAERVYQGRRERYDARVAEYRGHAADLGLDPERTIVPRGVGGASPRARPAPNTGAGVQGTAGRASAPRPANYREPGYTPTRPARNGQPRVLTWNPAANNGQGGLE